LKKETEFQIHDRAKRLADERISGWFSKPYQSDNNKKWLIESNPLLNLVAGKKKQNTMAKKLSHYEINKKHDALDLKIQIHIRDIMYAERKIKKYQKEIATLLRKNK